MASTGSISSLTASVRALGDRLLTLAALEGRLAGLCLASMLGLALGAASFAITGWFALLACMVLALVQNDMLGWGGALAIVALLSFGGAGGLAFMVVQRSRYLLFPATRRQLARIGRAGSTDE